LIATADAQLNLNGNHEYAGKRGTLYGEWHTTYRNVPTPLYGNYL